MAGLTNEQIILLVLVILVLTVGSGLFIWQKISNKPIIAGLIEPESLPENFSQNLAASSETALEPGPSAVKPEEVRVEKEEERIVFHVAGEVTNPGVYELTGEVRVVDAIRAAGGEGVLADLDRLNLAAPVYDGEKIYVPAVGEETPGSLDNTATGGSGSQQGSSLVNINTADAEQLEQLPGIGPSKAASIIKYRRQIGRFKDPGELLDVSGIGEKTLEQIKDEITL